MSHLPSYELSFSVLQVFKTTTLIQDIASYAIDPRPWLIVFGEVLSREDHEYLCLEHLETLLGVLKFTYGKDRLTMVEMEPSHNIIFQLAIHFINTFDPSDVFENGFTERQRNFDIIEILYMKCKNFVSYFTCGNSKKCEKLIFGTYRSIIYRKFPYQYTTRQNNFC